MGDWAAGESDSRAAAFVARLREMPDEHRSFSVPAAQAQREYRMAGPLLDRLVTHGLPYLERDSQRRFDHHDLLNLSLELGLRSVWTAGMRSWPRALGQDGEAPKRCRVGYIVNCPDPAHPGPCWIEVLTPGGVWVSEEVAQGTGPATLRTESVFTLERRWPWLPDPVARLAYEVAQLKFARLPWSVQLDFDFIRRSGLADCAGAATLLVDEGRRRDWRRGSPSA